MQGRGTVRLQDGICCRTKLLDHSVQLVVIGIKNVKTTRNTVIDFSKFREIMMILDMVMAMQRGNPAHALAIYDSLPSKWQQQKSIMQIRILTANQVAVSNLQKGQPMGDDYRKAVKDFQHAFPNAENLARARVAPLSSRTLSTD